MPHILIRNASLIDGTGQSPVPDAALIIEDNHIRSVSPSSIIKLPAANIEVGESGGMPDYGIRKAREVVEIHKQSITKAHRAGVKIAMGTDSAVTPHGQNLRELGLMVSIGMSPMEAIVASTSIAAACLGWDDRLGTLESGKLADLILVKDDPLKNIRSLENVDNISLVMKDGKIVKNILQ